jgi:hypothetical protein
MPTVRGHAPRRTRLQPGEVPLLSPPVRTGTVIAWNGDLSVITGIAFVACRGWTAGPRRERAAR